MKYFAKVSIVNRTPSLRRPGRDQSSTWSSAAAISDDGVAAVLAHMNGDHADDRLLIARAFDAPEATAAVIMTLDRSGGTWVHTFDAEHELTVPWSGPTGERAEIRREIVRLYDLSCEKLGSETRPH